MAFARFKTNPIVLNLHPPFNPRQINPFIRPLRQTHPLRQSLIPKYRPQTIPLQSEHFSPAF
jgi:hypothetical protein